MYFKIGDAKYSYTVHGQGTPIVLLHGFTGRALTWNRLVERLQDKFKIITIDLPGHGLTSTETPRTMEHCCDDLKQLFKHLQLTSVHLIGYSMGGRTALSFAMIYPELIKTLTLESASPGLSDAQERARRRAHDEHLIKRIQSNGLKSFVDFWEEIPLFETQNKLSSHVKQEVRKERMSQSTEGLIRSLRYMGTGQQPSWWHQLEQLDHPVQLIVGKLDHKFVTINQQMKQRFQRAELAIVEHAGHAVHLEQPDEFERLLTHFIHKHTVC